MKKIFTIAFILSTFIMYGQAFSGKGDEKVSIGANFQDNANGINVGYDYGLGENISLGLNTTYALNLANGLNANFSDRFDIKARVNANLGSILNIDDNFDFYPGISLSLKNLGGHLGMRYFFSSGFGLYSEFGTTLSKYSTKHLSYAEKLHNQFSVNVGAIFNL